jgi:hypothetical protein
MQQCFGLTRTLRRCGRRGSWRFFCDDHRRQPVAWIFFLVFTVIAGTASIYSAWFTGIDKEGTASLNLQASGTAKPDVFLRLVYPRAPALILINHSSAVARDIKYAVAVWNMDLPNRADPLPIPISTFDWIRPFNESGPSSIFGSPSVAQLLRPGDRLFGYIFISCPDSTRDRGFIVYIVWGEGGWFSEDKRGNSSEGLDVPREFSSIASRTEYFRSLESAVPKLSRRPIGELR